MHSPRKRIKCAPVKYVEFFCKSSKTVTEALCANFLKLRIFIAGGAGGSSGQRSLTALTESNFADEMAKYIKSIRRHASRGDAHALLVAVLAWEKTGQLTREDEGAVLRIVNNMHDNHLYYLKTTRALGRCQCMRGTCAQCESGAPAVPPAPAADAPAAQAARVVPAAQVVPVAQAVPVAQPFVAAPAPAPAGACLVHRPAPAAPARAAALASAAALARLRRLLYEQPVADVDPAVLRGLDAAVLLPARRWDWAAEIEAFFGQA